jgi:hypothetical protein
MLFSIFTAIFSAFVMTITIIGGHAMSQALGAFSVALGFFSLGLRLGIEC